MNQRRAAKPWIALTKTHPPINRQVLVRQREAVGFVADVACFLGKQPDGELRWVLSDQRIESRQITHWAAINDVEMAA